MNSIKYISCFAVTVITAAIFTACSKKDITAFKASAAVNFVSKSVSYSFLGNPDNEYVQEIDVRIIGDAADHDRHFSVEVVSDTFTTAPANLYQVMDGIVKAGEFTGKLYIKLINAPELATTSVSLKVKLIDSEELNAGNIESSEFIITWTDKVVVPSWSYYRYFFTSVASTAAYKLIVQTTGYTTFTASQYIALGPVGAQAVGTQFGDYVKQWNKDHPNDHLKHDDGAKAGEDIVPLYYTKSKYD